MKRTIYIPLFLTLFWVACQAEDKSSENLEAKVSKLETEIKKLKKVLKHAARLDVDQTYAQIMEQEKLEKVAHEIPVGKSPRSGPAKAEITIVEFSDFECPYCFRRSTEVKKIQEKFGDRVAVIFKHFPLSFHKKAPAAHAASIAAQNQGKFWEFRYAIAGEYRTLTEAKFIEGAKKAGLDVEKFKKDMKLDATKQSHIDEDMSVGSKVGVRGTPTFFVNGKISRDFSFASISAMLKK
jgi:protein-disulfide isomerase